jgi:hypothetical protein
MKKYGRVGEATDDNILWRTRSACWIANSNDTHPEYVLIVAYPQQ